MAGRAMRELVVSAKPTVWGDMADPSSEVVESRCVEREGDVGPIVYPPSRSSRIVQGEGGGNARVDGGKSSCIRVK